MTPREAGFLLLTSHLGDPQRKVLTVPQLRLLSQCVTASTISDRTGEVTVSDLMAMGFNNPSAQRVIALLSETERLQWYLEQAKKTDCSPVTRVSVQYPLILRKRLGLDSPGCLWAKGNTELLTLPMIALVGSRELKQENRLFAEAVGKAAAEQGFILLSGNAKGADQTAQKACLAAGGKVVSVVADRLDIQPERDGVLYLSEDGFDLSFSSQRALSRNRVIHGMAVMTFVAQCTLGKGGTWDGTVNNLKHNYSPVFCFDDGSPAAVELIQRGAAPIKTEMLGDLEAVRQNTAGLLDGM